ncbi:hypothetical protein [Cupriavidus lacunae]|uniref:Uncharacterized protein n=1 Tax=Cupriavidus lacunae TaxID=2666307 RepID=A0A370NPS0_9BURK|nr:hypothetical protein [Cupriavidus lacunae]RDK07513.1 hypothetical protein DN412_25765 [Cupriavidus lacunae]
MKILHPIPLMAMAMLTAVSGAALAQHVVGGMGEEVRIGAFSGPTHRINGRAEGLRLDSSKPDKGPRQSANQHAARPTGGHGPVPTLPGRHLP